MILNWSHGATQDITNAQESLYHVPSAAVSAAVTGTITAATTETDIVAGGKTIIITLTGDTWIAAGAASFDLQRDEILQGLDSAQGETFGWNNIVRDLEPVTSVVRTSDTVVTITLAGSVTYDITAQETITVAVPGTAVVGSNPIDATPTFTVDTSGEGHPVVRITQLEPSALSTRRYGSFAGRPDFGALIDLLANGIISAEAFGAVLILPGGVVINCTGIATEEAFGTTVVLPGGVTILPSSIDSAEAVGSPLVFLGDVGGGASLDLWPYRSSRGRR